MDIEIRPAEAQDGGPISQVIISALRISNVRDYSATVIAQVEKNFTPAAVAHLLEQRTVFVATRFTQVVGTASLDGDVVRTVFVAPDLQGHGIGRQLMAAVEQCARGRGVELLRVPSSVTAEPFYSRLGFTRLREVFNGEERTLVMQRRLLDTADESMPQGR